jgi:hypothetical protein
MATLVEVLKLGVQSFTYSPPWIRAAQGHTDKEISKCNYYVKYKAVIISGYRVYRRRQPFLRR